jgi:small subunit ribosomal protein S13e
MYTPAKVRRALWHTPRTPNAKSKILFFFSMKKKKTKFFLSRVQGISKSARPYRRTPASWVKLSAKDVADKVCKYARKGASPSAIGVLLRDQHGVGLIANVTNTKVLRILRRNGLAPAIPEDLYCLIKKAVAIRKHLEKNRKDKDSKYRLILCESRIHRLARYYKTAGAVPPNWKYESSTASALLA